MKQIFALLLAMTLLLSGCNIQNGSAADANGAGKLTSSLTPGEIPTGTSVDAAPLTAFSRALLSAALQGEGENPVLSPLSAYLCLVLAANGAEGATKDAFQSVLGLDTDALNTFSHDLIARLTDASGNTQLSIADSVWSDDDKMTLDPEYLQRIVDYCDADAFSYDLPSDEALQAVNDWVNEKTMGLIPKLHDDNYTPDTVLLLINALYFKAKWERPFKPYATSDDPFYLTDGSSIETPFLHAGGDMALIRAEGAEGIVLPYDDGKTAFVALRPSDGRTVRALAADLSAESLSVYMAGAETTFMNFSMPKFAVEFSFDMNDVLSEMGLAVMFDGENADFSRIGTSSAGNISVSRVLQRVKLIVDEEGTEASAITESLVTSGMMMDPVELHLDSPFLYAVMDIETGAPLFVGILDNPA